MSSLFKRISKFKEKFKEHTHVENQECWMHLQLDVKLVYIYTGK